MVGEYNAPGRTCIRRRPQRWSRPWLPHSLRRGDGWRFRWPERDWRCGPRSGRPKRSLWRACTSRWPACRLSCRCSCGAARRSWRASGTHQLPRAGHAQPAGAVGGRAPDRVLELGARIFPGTENPLSIMDLLFGKLVLLGYEGTELRHRYPSAETLRPAGRAARRRGGGRRDRRRCPNGPSLSLFEVRRRRRGPLLVVWDQRDAFDGEDEPPVALDWPWPAAPPVAVDALGQAQPVSLTPMVVAAD